jgi:predicted permease
MLSDLRFRMRTLLQPGRAESELDDELRFHREAYIEQLEARGHSRAEAERMARIELGGISQVKDETRDAWGIALLQGLADDWRFSFRMLLRHRVFSAACILTLALGIGATTAVFSVLDATLIRPLPFADADRLTNLNVYLTPSWNGDLNALYVPSQVELIRWREAQAFTSMDAIEPRLIGLSGRGDPEVVNGAAVTAGLFATLGVAPATGRVFTAAEEKSNAHLAVVSDGFVRQHFSENESPLGKTVVLDGATYEIVGVMPRDFRLLIAQSEIWIPLNPAADPARAAVRIMNVVGRLRPGVTREQAQAELEAISARIAREFPNSHSDAKPLVRDLRQQIYGTRRPAMFLLAGAVALLLSLACVNLFNLMLGHISVRRTEFAIRSVIGGERWRLARLQLVETGVLAMIGGGLGIAIMAWVVRALLALDRRQGSAPIDAILDWRVAGFGVFVTLAVAVLSGVVPALRAQNRKAETTLAFVSAARVGGSMLEGRIRAGLLVAQVALAVTLLCASGVFVMSLRRLMATSAGFAPQSVWTGQLRLSPLRYPDIAARSKAVQQFVERIAAIPGVTAAGTTQTTFLPNQSMQTLALVEGRTIDERHPDSFHIRHITPGYFAALQAPVIEGRAIDDRDQPDTAPVCMVNARLAKQLWPNESAIGHRIRRAGGGNLQWMTVVGVAGDIMDNGLGVSAPPTLYVAYYQRNTPTARVTLVVRTSDQSSSPKRAIENAIWSVDPEQPVDALAPLPEVLAQSTGDQRFQAILLGCFALVGMLLAMTGVYGVTGAAVTARSWEMGVRMALGATAASVIREMLAQSAQRVGLGVVLGLGLFFGFGRLTASLLYQTSPADPWILTAAVLPLVVTALAICFVQARHLGKVDPVSALRNDL